MHIRFDTVVDNNNDFIPSLKITIQIILDVIVRIVFMTPTIEYNLFSFNPLIT